MHADRAAMTMLTSKGQHLKVLGCQVEGEALVTQPAYSRLHSELWNRQWQALQRCKPTALVVAASQRRAAEQQLVDLDRKPPEVAGCALYPHQLQVHASTCTRAL